MLIIAVRYRRLGIAYVSETHEQEDFVNCRMEVLKVERDIQNRRIEEAVYKQSQRLGKKRNGQVEIMRYTGNL